MALMSILRVRVGALSGALGVFFAGGSAWACQPLVGTPPFPPGPQPQAYVAFGTALAEQQDGSRQCALHHYKIAEKGFRQEMRSAKALSERRKAIEHLVATLSNLGVLVSRRNRPTAKRDWSEAASLYQSIHPYPALSARGDSFFDERWYKEAFRAYEESFFPSSRSAMLNPQETDSEAAFSIRKGLRLAALGRFRDAERVFGESPQSQVATYLQAQSYFAAGERAAAYQTYVQALTIAPPTTSDVPSLGPVSLSVWKRLIVTLVLVHGRRTA